LAAGILLPVCLTGGSINDAWTIGELVVPRGSPFWFSYEGEYDGGSAHIFVGDFVVSGTYYYGYERGRTATLVHSAGCRERRCSTTIEALGSGETELISLTLMTLPKRRCLAGSVIDKIANKQLSLNPWPYHDRGAGYEVTGECDLRPVLLAKFNRSIGRRT